MLKVEKDVIAPVIPMLHRPTLCSVVFCTLRVIYMAEGKRLVLFLDLLKLVHI